MDGLEMAYTLIMLDKADGIATITLNRPDKLNPMNEEILAEMAHAITAINDDDSIRAIIITGAGRAFSAGRDIDAELATFEPRQGPPRRAARLEPVAEWTGSLRQLLYKPTIGAVNGIAVGGGLALALLCDIIVASERAQFGAMFVRRGMPAVDGVTYLLPRIVGLAKANEMLLTGELIDAPEAYRLGLINKVVPHEELMIAAEEYAAKIAQGASIAVELTKMSIYRGLDSDLASQLAYEAWAWSVAHETRDAREGLQAFVEKRDARFEGR
ncbi:MAG TPA: enoyl-CoA hydratase/isomerase family protein [Dehalococcoidia bacterium]|nr:enoyl-CoA hydratase/isomerase family protein [Dehalococcoidia bacterium]